MISFVYIMQEEDKDSKIAALEAKVKQLEREISERVRNFLVRNKEKQATPTRSSHQHTQTDSLSQDF